MKEDTKNYGNNPGGGIGSNCIARETRFVDERPTDWWNQHEANSHRGYVRGTDGTRNGRRVTGGGGQGGGY